jgi:hypothetical protein
MKAEDIDAMGRLAAATECDSPYQDRGVVYDCDSHTCPKHGARNRAIDGHTTDIHHAAELSERERSGKEPSAKEMNEAAAINSPAYCPDCGKQCCGLIESTEPDEGGEYKDVWSCRACENIFNVVRGI